MAATVGDVLGAPGASAELRIVGVTPLSPGPRGPLGRGPSSRGAAGRMRRPPARRPADRVALYDLENHAGTPVYVHAKACLVDDTWATIGSDNLNRRSWTRDSIPADGR